MSPFFNMDEKAKTFGPWIKPSVTAANERAEQIFMMILPGARMKKREYSLRHLKVSDDLAPNNNPLWERQRSCRGNVDPRIAGG